MAPPFDDPERLDRLRDYREKELMDMDYPHVDDKDFSIWLGEGPGRKALNSLIRQYADQWEDEP